MHVLFVTPALDRNSLGRTFSLWLLAEELGWTSEIYAEHDALPWRPLRDTQFAASCRSGDDPICPPDVIYAIKPVTDSMRPARHLSKRFHVPWLVDIDDPDVQSRFGATPKARLRQLGGCLVRRRPLDFRDRWSAWRASTMTTSVSNPALQRWYTEAALIPHVRSPRPMAAHNDRPAVVAFVGTPRRHKGIDVLRDAVAEASMELVITASAPPDARTNERWVGETSFAEGVRLVEESDIVAVPSLEVFWGRAQFPVKVLDAMMAGRAIIASDVPPLRWATNGAAVLVAPGDGAALRSALRSLADRNVRHLLGARAHREAVSRFAPAVVAPAFERVVRAAG